MNLCACTFVHMTTYLRNYKIQLNLALGAYAKYICYNLILVHNKLLQPSLRIKLIGIFIFWYRHPVVLVNRCLFLFSERT
jgi:hypothetical protein